MSTLQDHLKEIADAIRKERERKGPETGVPPAWADSWIEVEIWHRENTNTGKQR